MPSIPFYNGQVVTPPDYRFPISVGHAMTGPLVAALPPPPVAMTYYGYERSSSGASSTAAETTATLPLPLYYKDMGYNVNYPFKPFKKSPAQTQPIPSYSSNGTTFYLSNVPLNNVAAPIVANGDVAKPQTPQVQITGGVASNLDYNIKDMAEFLSNMAYGIMDTSGLDREPEFMTSFSSFVNQVLTATRLPRETVILALVYLSKRWALNGLPNVRADSSASYRMLVVALLLANKFHDDNTFTNKSWFEATGIPISQLTACEAAWLKEIKWSLHLHEKDFKGWEKWNDCWKLFVSPKYHQPMPKSAGRLSFPVPSYRVTQSPKSSSPKRSTYTIPKWYEAANQQFHRSSVPPQMQQPISAPPPPSGPPPYAPMAMMPEAPFVSYFQQSFAVDGGHHHQPQHHLASKPIGHQSYYVSAYNNMATCNCNVCSFDARQNWYMGGVVAC